MVTKPELIQELNFLSDKLSERSRAIAAGVIAIWWAALMGDKTPNGLVANALIGPVIAAATSIALDVLQYVVGYTLSRYVLDRIEREKLSEFKLNKNGFLFKLRELLFLAKQFAAMAAIIWLIIILVRKFWP
jgi:hypothetical protein